MPGQFAFAAQRQAFVIVAVLSSAGACLLAGCGSLFNPSGNPSDAAAATQSKTREQAGAFHVEADAAGLTLQPNKDIQRACNEFCTNLDRLLTDKRLTTANRYVWRHADLSLEVLQHVTGKQAASPTIRFIAHARDQQCTLDAQAGWEVLLADRAANPERYADYDRARAEYLEALKQGHAKQAAAIPLDALAEKLPGPMPMIEAGQLTGVALQLASSPADAATVLGRTADLAARHDIHQAAYVLLLLSDAQRVAGQFPAAAQCWQSAANLASELIVRPIAVCDPVFWQRAAYLRPVKLPWPDAVQQRLAQASHLPSAEAAGGKPAEAECALFACLGMWRLERDEPQAALLDFKRAETNTADSLLQDRLQQAQAKALSRLQQSGAATAILMALAHKPDPGTSRPAMALLGSLKLESGQLEFGFKMLQRALEQQPQVDWSTRAEAEADLGLAYLMMGEEPTGLRWLHEAQQRFESEGRLEMLAKSLRNESGYWQHKGKHKAEIAALDDRLQSLENGSATTAQRPATPHAQASSRSIIRLPAQ